MFGKFARLFFASIVLLLNLACSKAQPYPPQVYEVFEAAGDNRGELEAVLEHYAAAGDSLKLQAAIYLIGNMEGHCYATYAMVDTLGNEIDFDVSGYPDFDVLQASCDSMESELGTLDFEKKDKVYDVETITAEFLIGQIDYAFRAWQEKPWAKGYSFEQFRDYILPYRGINEPLEPWREFFWNKYADVESKMSDSADPIEAARLINSDVKSYFTFDPRWYYHPTDQGLAEMLESGLGRCEDMTNITIYAMRANGLPVTSDYTPHWANTGNNHAWNSIGTPDGKVVPFMGAESSPGDYSLAYKPAKVYRKTFGKQPGNLIFQERKQEKVPAWLAAKNYVDVTADYVPVQDFTITFEKQVPDSVDIAYICVFNSGEWRAIDWARIKNGVATFTDIGTDIAYIPALYINAEIEPWGPPFILNEDGSRQELRPGGDNVLTARLSSTTRRKQDASTEGIAKTFLAPGKEYELSYWESDGWQAVGKSTAGKKPLTFENVPAGCLYWLVAEGSDKDERIFTLEDGVQVWW